MTTFRQESFKDQRIFIAGRTGSGKTYAAKALTAGWRNLIAYDASGRLDLHDAKVIADIKELKKMEAGRYVYTPPDRELFDPDRNEENLAAFFKFIYRRENTLLFIDEIDDVIIPGKSEDRSTDRHLRAILKRGRKKDIGVVALTQRPANIPKIFYSEADQYFVFRLQDEADRRRVCGWIGKVDFNDLGRYECFYYDLHTSVSPTVVKIGD